MPLLFRYLHRVTYSDCTLGNHIYYGRYLDILEAARGEFFRHLGIPFLQMQEQGTIFPVIECRLRYKAAARYDEVITVEVYVTRAEKVRLEFSYRVSNAAGKLLVEGETCHVCTGTDDRIKRLPPAVLQAITVTSE